MCRKIICLYLVNPSDFRSTCLSGNISHGEFLCDLFHDKVEPSSVEAYHLACAHGRVALARWLCSRFHLDKKSVIWASIPDDDVRTILSVPAGQMKVHWGRRNYFAEIDIGTWRYAGVRDHDMDTAVFRSYGFWEGAWNDGSEYTDVTVTKTDLWHSGERLKRIPLESIVSIRPSSIEYILNLKVSGATKTISVYTQTNDRKLILLLVAYLASIAE